jgi:hypothetical protein
MSSKRLQYPLPAAARASAIRGGLRARLKPRPSRARDFNGDEPAQSNRQKPSLPRVSFLEHPELPPFEEWIGDNR